MASKVSSDYMRRQSICVFAATEESAANDLARSLIAGADAIDRLAQIERQVRELRGKWRETAREFLRGAAAEELERCADDLDRAIAEQGERGGENE